ncbi:MAG: autotransporter domain-containing protein [Rhizobiales bacterium]|nr:autotransporter domain-containing protein [Hyphomicrobiales bacterium]
MRNRLDLRSPAPRALRRAATALFVTAALAAGTSDRARAETGLLLYAPSIGDGTTSAFTTNADGSLNPTATIGTGAGSGYAWVRPDQAFAYVTSRLSNSIRVIDTATQTVVQTIATGAAPFSLSISADGSRLVVVNTNSNSLGVYSIDPATGQLTATATIGTGTSPRGVVISADGGHAYAVNRLGNTISAIDLTTNTVTATIAVGNQPLFAALNPAGTRLFVTNFSSNTVSVIDVATNTVIATVPSGNGPDGVVVSPDGNHFYVANRVAGTVSIYNANIFALLGSVASGSLANGVTISPDGTTLYVSNGSADNVTAYTIAAGTGMLTAIGSYATGTNPGGPGMCGNGSGMLAMGAAFYAKSAGAFGCFGGTATFTGGTLVIAAAGLGTITTPMVLEALGGAIDTAGNNATMAGAITGTGGLIKVGAGTLTLSGASSYLGATLIYVGTLRAGAANAFSASSAYTVASGAILDLNGFNQTIGSLTGAGSVTLGAATLTAGGDNSSTPFSGTITGTGGLTKTGTGTLTLSGANGYFGATLVDAGTLRAGAVNAFSASSAVTVASGAILDLAGFNQTIASLSGAGGVTLGAATLTAGGDNSSTPFSGTIIGSGGLTKTGTGTLTLSGASTYGGPTLVSAGGLVVDGSITSAVTVQSGALLGGHGAVGNLIMNGTLSPGNSIGTITVNGHATLAAGSTTIIEVSAVAADRINVTGTASLAGGLHLVAVGSGFSFGTQYTLLSAAGGLSGSFNPVAVTGTFGPAITTVLSYGLTDAVLTLQANALTPLLPAGAPANTANVAGGIDRATAHGANPTAFMAVYLQSPTQMAASLSTLSGEAATGTQTAALNASSLFLNLMLDPMVGSRGASASGAGPSLIQMADLNAAAQPAARVEAGWSLWTKAFGQSGRTQGDAATGSAATSGGLYGVAAGADKRLSADTLIGFALAGGGTSYGLGGRGGGTGDLFQVGLYGSTRFGNGYVSAAVAYGWNGFDIKRNVNLAGPETYSSRVTAQTYGGRLETGWRFGQRAFGWTPYAALEAIGYSAPGYSETSNPAGGAFGLSFAAKSLATVRSELGVRLDGQTRVSETADLITYGRLAWAYQGNTERSIDAQFQALSNSGFTVFGARPSMHTALASVGAELRLAGGFRLSSTLEGELGTRHQAVRANAGLRYEW